MKTTIRRCALSIACVFTLNLFFPVYSFAQPANDLCANAISLTVGTFCANTAGTLVAATNSGAVPGACGGGTDNDVWYTFVAGTATPTIAVSTAPNQISIQLLSGTCAGLASVQCVTTATTNANLVAAGLTPGTTYYVRVFSNNNTAGTFNICITNPSNNLCGAAITLTSRTSCINDLGTIQGATLTATTINPVDCAPAGITRDVWYRFVAQTTNPTITLSNLGPNFTNPGIQLLSNNCGGSFTSYFCGTTSIAADFLTPGTTYFIRVFTTTAAAAPTAIAGAFNICIVDPVATPPFNDECANAINIPVGINTCGNNINGTVSGATASAVPVAPCTAPVVYDVWYKFTAISITSTITIGGGAAPTNFPAANRRLQLFSGTCGSLTSIACGTTTIAAFATTVGVTYYVRVYSDVGPIPNGNANFNICVNGGATSPIRFGNSYVNVTKQTAGGVVEPGDVLEIRMTVNHTSGTVYRARYVDNIPTNTTKATGADAPIRIITNEGLIYKSYTPGAGDDPATYVAAPPAGQFNIRVNLGFGATLPGTPVNNTSTEAASAIGTMIAGSDRPRGGGGLLFATAYRVVVTGNAGDTINLNAAQFLYKTAPGVGSPDVVLTGTPFKILISDPLTLCPNSVGINIADEFGGTFGSGTTLNRSSDLTTPIPGYSFIPDVNAMNGVGDGRYALVKNISPRSGTVRTARRRNSCNVPAALAQDDLNNCNKRMFDGFWFIDGDHTGTNDAIGNTPPAGPANSGYMLMVNADYVASEVYRQTINNLCPDTYYEFSAWVRNICPTCGIDSTGAQFAGTPTAPASGYPGVYPNLSFALNDVDYYNTGQVDTVGWVKKGFVFRTDTAQTSATFTIRNNSQGGGGNDWVIDDIAVATCLPTMSYSPTINPNVCRENPITIADTISSFFRNYTTYKWQRSTDGGANWTDITGVTTIPDTNYYITSYTIPPIHTTMADSGDLYRVVVATTADNLLDPNCNISDGITISLTVIDCGTPLKTDLLSFNGKLVADKGHLSWTTSKEDGPITFTIERSTDGINFTQAGSVNSHNNYTSIENTYSFIDPVAVTGKVFYRLLMTDQSAAKKYSRIIQLNRAANDNLALVTVINPFNYSLDFDISAKNDSKIEVELVDLYGKVVLKNTFLVRTGINALSLANTESLSSGTYVLRVRNNEILINRKVLKKIF
ncbi:MAG TPA: T9SS type A sorting domain-containing protein [Chitinophagaceae bacterium]